jgi:hypothetical protein
VFPRCPAILQARWTGSDDGSRREGAVTYFEPMGLLDRNVAVIPGAGSGIGEATARLWRLPLSGSRRAEPSGAVGEARKSSNGWNRSASQRNRP